MAEIDVSPRIHVNSIAGKASCCYVDSINIAFDMGINFLKSSSQAFVFISHGHIDHIQGIISHAGERSLTGAPPAKYYVPSHLVPHVQRIFKSFIEMQESDIPANIIGVDANTVVRISSKVAVKAFPTVHRVESLGYVAYSISKTLKEEYVGLTGQELGALRKQNIAIDVEQWTPQVAYTGDTRIDFFLDQSLSADFLRAKVLVTECTFLGDKSKETRATETGHIHLNQLIQIQDRFQNDAVVLTHFSARYSFSYIQETISMSWHHDGPNVYAAYGDKVAQVVETSRYH